MVRAATPADLAGVRAIAHEHDLLDHWPAGPDFLDAELTYGRLGVAAPDGVVTGFTGTLPRGTLIHLGDLFVHAGAQSRGLGRALLRYALAGAQRVITFASRDPRAMALYLAAGLVPRTPLLYLDGRPHTPPDPVPGAREGDLDRALELDATASGGPREALLRWYHDRDGVVVHTAGGSYAFARTLAGRVVVGPAGGVPAALAAVRAAGDRELHLAVPGAHPLLPALVRAGLRIGDLDTVMSTTPDVDLAHYLPGADLG